MRNESLVFPIFIIQVLAYPEIQAFGWSILCLAYTEQHRK